MNLLELLETRRPGERPEPAEPGAVDPTRLGDAARRRHDQAVVRLASEGGGRLIRHRGMRLVVFRRRHPLPEGSDLLTLGRRPVRRAFSGYTGAPAFLELDPRRLLFLDTETTGLSHGAGTFAFLIGLAVFRHGELVTTRLFIPEPPDEPLALRVLQGFLRRHPYLVSFNGKSYDIHILRSRLTLNDPARYEEHDLRLLPHLDLYHLSRRLWRHRLPRARLQDVEREILGYERQGDVAGALIPSIYFDHLLRASVDGMQIVLEHNLLDVVSMARLVLQIADRLAANRFEDREEALAVAKMMMDKRVWSGAADVLASAIPSANDRKYEAWRGLVLRLLRSRLAPPPIKQTLFDQVGDRLGRDPVIQRIGARLST
jgi:uncharacterized protein YprB with RNaseH-like and TPR domain